MAIFGILWLVGISFYSPLSSPHGILPVCATLSKFTPSVLQYATTSIDCVYRPKIQFNNTALA